jgi:CP family cyanate transporter-like MFS transporter
VEVGRKSGGRTLLVIVLVAINLRTVIASLPPLLDYVRGDLGLSASVAGLLTAAPVLLFGLLAPVAPWLGRRIALERLIALCAGLTMVAGLLAGLGTAPALFASSCLAGAGVAVSQATVPTLIRMRFPASMGGMTGAYTMALPLGGALASATTVPIFRIFDDRWAPALAVWALPVAVALALWMPIAIRGHSVLHATEREPARDEPLAWAVAAFFGMQSLVFYSALAWLPTILQANGFSASTAGLLQALNQIVSMLPAFVVPVLAMRMASQLPLLASAVVSVSAGAVGLLAAPSAAPLWIVLLGLGQGATLGLAFILPALRARTPHGVAALTAMMLSVGFLMASAGPWILGVAHDLTGGWTVPLIVLAAAALLELVPGAAASRPQQARSSGDVAGPEPCSPAPAAPSI